MRTNALPTPAPFGLPDVMEALHPVIAEAARFIEICGVAVILGSIVVATALFITGGRRTRDWTSSYERYRANLGRGILLGLEFLVGADIIGTITNPMTFQSVALLGLVVLIRTFLSFSLETEIEGCWPWQRRAAGDQGSGRESR